jgi:hypothetical protein
MKRNAMYLFIFLFCVFSAAIPAEDALKSIEEGYYDFLSLQGIIERPTLNYRTLSDTIWQIPDGTPHLWEGINLGTQYTLAKNVSLRIYGPNLFMSVNTSLPYGQNDGALWQGRGFNTSLTTGIRLKAYGVEATLKPQLSFSQNAPFDLMPSNYDSPYGYIWGYAGSNKGADAPQRFGDKPFFTYDWGDTEIRYAWRSLTIGFGTQSIWLGPAKLNPILHSNNAPSYPKLDLGIRRQPITIPKLNWYLGDIEFRIWTGYLSESDYFDNDPLNNHNMLHGLSFAYAPSFLPGLTLFINRTCLIDWKWENIKYIIPVSSNTEEDQKASFGFSWLLPKAGFELYGELGVDDYGNKITRPFHSMVYLFGFNKSVKLFRPDIMGEIIFEWSSLEMSQDFQFQWPYTFYFHHLITQGYTNRGQWLGSGYGTGGNSQYLGFKVYYPRGYGLLSLYRVNPDNSYVYKDTIGTVNVPAADGGTADGFFSFYTILTAGLQFVYYPLSNLGVSGGFDYHYIANPHYDPNVPSKSNFTFSLSAQYSF